MFGHYEMYAVRWFILVEYGYVELQLGCNGVHHWCGGLQVVCGAMSRDGVGVGAAGGIVGQRGSYVAVLGAEPLWVEWVSWVPQHWAL